MEFFRAKDRARTGHLDLGKVALYQMSYFRLFLFFQVRFPCKQTQTDKELFRDCKNKGYRFLTKIFIVYLYCGVYNVFDGTFTSGLPL
jgi:hypothetical protein